MWLLGIAAGGLIVAALILRRALSGSSSTSDIDVGTVSDGWIAEQKGRKD